MKLWSVVLVSLAACHDTSVAPGPAPGASAQSVSVSSPSVTPGAPISVDHTCDGMGQSPQLTWSAMPDKTKSIAIVVDDPDAPKGTFTHWIVWNIASSSRMLGVGANGGLAGGVSGTNDLGHEGYDGPCPPKGALHHYHFRVYGLDTMLTLKPSDKRSDLDRAMNGHVVAQGDLVGTFQH